MTRAYYDYFVNNNKNCKIIISKFTPTPQNGIISYHNNITKTIIKKSNAKITIALVPEHEQIMVNKREDKTAKDVSKLPMI